MFSKKNNFSTLKLMIVFSLAFLLFCASSYAGYAFEDVYGHWAQNTIIEMKDNGIISGVNHNGKYYFRPNNFISRAEFITMIVNAFEFKTDENNIVKFSDVNELNWFYKNVTAASSNSLVNGYPGGVFKPNDYISRAEIAAIGMNVIKTFSNLSNIENSSVSFKDVEINSWYYNNVHHMRSLGIINGYADNTFRPRSNSTRAEALVIISNVLKIKTENTYQNLNSKLEIYSFNAISNSDDQILYSVRANNISDLGKFNFKIEYDPRKIVAYYVFEGDVRERGYINMNGKVDIFSNYDGYITITSNDETPVIKEEGVLFTIQFFPVEYNWDTANINIKGINSENAEIYNSKGDIIHDVVVKLGEIIRN